MCNPFPPYPAFDIAPARALPSYPPPSREEVEKAQTQKPVDLRRALADLLAVATSAHYAMADAVVALKASGHSASVYSSVLRARDALQSQCDAIRRDIGPQVHVLKADPGPFRAVWAGIKKYEVRRFDRDFRVGDELKLVEFDREEGRYSGAWIVARVTAITAPGEYELPPGIGVLGIEVAKKAGV